MHATSIVSMFHGSSYVTNHTAKIIRLSLAKQLIVTENVMGFMSLRSCGRVVTPPFELDTQNVWFCCKVVFFS